jgi:hypothetical protein
MLSEHRRNICLLGMLSCGESDLCNESSAMKEKDCSRQRTEQMAMIDLILIILSGNFSLFFLFGHSSRFQNHNRCIPPQISWRESAETTKRILFHRRLAAAKRKKDP